MGFWDALRNAPPTPTPMRPTQPLAHEVHHGRTLATKNDPAAAIRRWRESGIAGGYTKPRTRMHMGFVRGRLGTSVGPWDGMCWSWTEPETHLLALGPPRSAAGKSASVMIPIVLSQFGPVVAASTKEDVFDATAIARAFCGRLWLYAPAGRTDPLTGQALPLPEGVRELCWSPLGNAGNWDTAIRVTSTMTTVAKVGHGMQEGGHWKSRAEDVLAPMLHWAALTGRPMRAVCAAVQEFERMGELAADELDRREDQDAHAAAGMLRGILRTSDRERAIIISTAATALEGYRLSAVLRSTDAPNFKADDFVTGGADGERADTIYITAPAEEQAAVAPLVVGLLDEICAATIRRHRREEHVRRTPSAGPPPLTRDTSAAIREVERLMALSPAERAQEPDPHALLHATERAAAERRAAERVWVDRNPSRATPWPVTLCLDELAGLAPLPKLPEMLRTGGSQGLQIAAAVQGLGQLKARWPDAADDLLTTFGQTLVFPGIQDVHTLEAVSKLGGEYDRLRTSASEGTTDGKFSNSVSRSTVRERVYPPDHIAEGVDPQARAQGKPPDPDIVLCLSRKRPYPLEVSPYWKATPWPQVLTDHLQRARTGVNPEWVQTVTDPPPNGYVQGLPAPNLEEWALRNYGNRDAWPWVREWAQRYVTLCGLGHLVPDERASQPLPNFYGYSTDPSGWNRHMRIMDENGWTMATVVAALNPGARAMVERQEEPEPAEWEIAFARLAARRDGRRR